MFFWTEICSHISGSLAQSCVVYVMIEVVNKVNML